MSRFPIWAAMLALLLSPVLAAADDVAGRTAIGLQSGFMKLTGGERDYSNVNQQVTLDLRRGLSPHWSLELAFKYGWLRPGVDSRNEDAGLTFDSGTSLYTVIWQPEFGLLWHPAPRARISPYLGLAAGVTSWRVKDLRGEEGAGINPGGATVQGFDEDGKRELLRGNDVTGSIALGAQFFTTANLALDLGARYHLFPGNKKDNVGFSDDWFFWGPDHVDANNGLAEVFAGLTLFFGEADKDKDGIPDKLDVCADQPEDIDGFDDGDGCPDLDNDRDGIPDGRDACPNEAEDSDGYQDSDGCPDPDNDGDGVLDKRDACPDEPEDVDGYDDADGCPDPDNDGDNVLDAYDECPNTTRGVQVDTKGCEIVLAPPTPAPPAVENIFEGRTELVLEGVTFLSGSAQLATASLAVLRRVADSLIGHPEVAIEIRGHTDNAGAASANRDLSQRRALAVRDHLIQCGVSPTRMTAVGFGEDFPIASNDTADGRAANRRVEIHRLER